LAFIEDVVFLYFPEWPRAVGELEQGLSEVRIIGDSVKPWTASSPHNTRPEFRTGRREHPRPPLDISPDHGAFR